MRVLRVHRQAQEELLHEVAYYSGLEPGLGVRFGRAVEAALVLAVRHPSAGAPRRRSTRSVLVKGFPFSIIYTVTPTEFVVIAIAAHRRRPGYWLERTP